MFYEFLTAAISTQEPELEWLRVESNVHTRFATTSICGTVYNDEYLPKEISFNIQLPNVAYFRHFDM